LASLSYSPLFHEIETAWFNADALGNFYCILDITNPVIIIQILPNF